MAFRTTAKVAACLAQVLLCRVVAADLPATQDPEAILQRIRSRMVQHLSRLHNYTCHVVIDRSVRSIVNMTTSQRDRIDLDVAFVGDRELFSRHGDSRFEEQPVSEIVPAGLIGDSAFGSHDDSLWSGHSATFKFEGPCKKDGHRTLRFSFRVSPENSRLLVKQNGVEAIVGYKGSVWVDATTLERVRLEWKTESIPRSVGISSVKKSMRYSSIQIGSDEMSLPVEAELSTFDQAGNLRLNLVHLEHCQEFKGESVVKYESPGSSEKQSRGSDRPRY